MQLTERFLEFTDQQLSPLAASKRFRHLGLYVSAPPDQEGPPLILVRQWSSSERLLPPAAAAGSSISAPSLSTSVRLGHA